jgi:2-polyprenyl-3-methyl-5-hydroxy-6-metoxy-1,4-benzoquinol methylase
VHKSFEEWNEEMYKKHGNENRYEHPNFFIRYNALKRVRSIIFFLNAKKTDDILELGCGAGLVMKQVKEYKSLTGIDVSQTALREASKNLKGKEKVSLLKGDVQNLKNLKIKKKFDRIICAEVIEHVPKPIKVIDTILRVSKKDSDIIITIPNEDLINLIFRVFKFFRIQRIFGDVAIKMDWHLHEFNLKKFKKLVKGKLIIIKVRRNPFWFFPLSYVVKCKPYERTL